MTAPAVGLIGRTLLSSVAGTVQPLSVSGQFLISTIDLRAASSAMAMWSSLLVMLETPLLPTTYVLVGALRQTRWPMTWALKRSFCASTRSTCSLMRLSDTDAGTNPSSMTL